MNIVELCFELRTDNRIEDFKRKTKILSRNKNTGKKAERNKDKERKEREGKLIERKNR